MQAVASVSSASASSSSWAHGPPVLTPMSDYTHSGVFTTPTRGDSASPSPSNRSSSSSRRRNRNRNRNQNRSTPHDLRAVQPGVTRGSNVGKGSTYTHHDRLQGVYAMFPNISKDVVRMVTDQCGGSTEEAIEFLLLQVDAAEHKQAGGQDYLSKLPLDAHLMIFTEFLDIYVLATLARVSRYFHDTIVSNVFAHIKEVHIASAQRRWRDNRLLAMVWRFPQLRTLSLRKCTEFSNFQLLAVGANKAALAESLRSLDLGGCDRLEDDDVQALAWQFHKMERLNLQGTHITDASLRVVGKLGGLLQLDLSDCGAISDAGVGSLLDQSSTLTALSLKNTAVTSMLAKAFRTRSLPLRRLGMHRCVKLQRFALAPRQSVLESINFSFCPNLTRISLQGMTCLTAINVSNCKNLTVLDLDAPKLTTLQASVCIWLADLNINSDCLEHVNLFQCRSLTMPSVNRLLGCSHSTMQVMVCGGMLQLRDEQVRVIMEEFGALSKLDLRGCKGVDKDVISHAMYAVERRIAAEEEGKSG